MDYEVSNETALADNPENKSLNGLMYVMPQSLSSSSNKTFIRQQSQRTEYKEQGTIVFDMNTGSSYIDPANCFLYFNVYTDSAADVTTNTNYSPLKEEISALALINEVHIHAKSGIELDRIQECNQYNATRHILECGKEHRDGWSRIWGGGPWIGGHAPIQSQIGNENTPTRICLPMSLISGLFRPTIKGMKMPPGLLSGARIEITLEEFGRAFSEDVGTAAATTYIVTDPVIICLAHTLNDSSQAVLNEQSVTNGLEYTYPRAFTAVEPSTSNSVNIQVKKAVSQGMRAFAVPVASLEYNDRASDSFYSSLIYDKYQFRVGTHFYPQQRIDSLVEGYLTTTNIYNKAYVSSWDPPALSYEDYAGATTQNYIQGAAFESDALLNISGCPINNSQTLSLESTVQAGGAEFRWYMFLEYTACARSFLTNVEVKI